MQIPRDTYVLCILWRVILPLLCIYWMLYSLEQELGAREKGGRYQHYQHPKTAGTKCQLARKGGSRRENGKSGHRLASFTSQTRATLQWVWQELWKSGKELRQSLISSVPTDWYMETKVTSSSSAHLVEFLIHIFFLIQLLLITLTKSTTSPLLIFLLIVFSFHQKDGTTLGFGLLTFVPVLPLHSREIKIICFYTIIVL